MWGCTHSRIAEVRAHQLIHRVQGGHVAHEGDDEGLLAGMPHQVVRSHLVIHCGQASGFCHIARDKLYFQCGPDPNTHIFTVTAHQTEYSYSASLQRITAVCQWSASVQMLGGATQQDMAECAQKSRLPKTALASVHSSVASLGVYTSPCSLGSFF